MGMLTGVTLSVTEAELDRLRAVVKDGNAPQKRVWRAQIVLLSADGVGTNAIMRETGNPFPRDPRHMIDDLGPAAHEVPREADLVAAGRRSFSKLR